MVNREPMEEDSVQFNFRGFIIILKPKAETRKNSRREGKREIMEEVTDASRSLESGKSNTVLENSQASPARLSGQGSLKVKA
jgi:hypothetical protein